MRNIEHLLNVVRREVYRVMQTYSHGKIAEVTSYDPKTHMAKVKFKPRDNESGWLPIQTHHVGDGFGVLVGLSKGDIVKVEPHNGDPNAMQITTRYHHDKAKPPKVESGEMLMKDKNGTTIFFDKDGNLHIKSKGNVFINGSGSTP
jgi:hypothetical protein